MKLSAFAGVIAVALTALVVTAGDPATASNTPSGGSGATASSTPYLGWWTARLSQTQLLDAGNDPSYAGRFRLILRGDGTYRTYNAFWSKGTFTVSGDRIVFADDTACKVGGFLGKGVYKWVITNRKLRLTQPRFGSDPCGGRVQTLTYPLWTRR
jgi:hypothetical protein